MGIALLIIGFLISFFLTPRLLVMLKEGGLERSNFKGKAIPFGTGIIFSSVLALTYLLLSITGRLSTDTYIFLGLLSLISLVGLIDDVAGNRNYTGFRGHFFSLLQKGRITTGLWKAALGGAVALLAAITSSISITDIILNGMLIALMANFFNLLDVRPGRSMKVFFLFSVLIVLFLPSYVADVLILPLIGIAMGYFPYDVKGQAMMGDAGSNLLGMAVGISLVAGDSYVIRNMTIVLLILLHFVSEYYSFSKIIEGNKILSFLDEWGRRD